MESIVHTSTKGMAERLLEQQRGCVLLEKIVTARDVMHIHGCCDASYGICLCTK